MHSVQIKNLTFGYGQNPPVISDISIDLERGHFVVILGENGCGKTTLLKLLFEKLSQTEPVGIAFQGGGLFDFLSVRENLEFILSEKKYPGDPIKVLETVGLREASEKPVYELSGGMQKRLSVARAYLLNPDFVLLDEPTGGLDPLTAEQIFEWIYSQHRSKKITTVIATSEYRKAWTFADRILVLAEGKRLFYGDKEAFQQVADPRIQVYL